MASSIVGIDIGTGGLRIAEYGHGAARLVNVRMPENMVDAGRIISPEEMARFIRKTRKENRIGAARCAVVLPGNLTFFRRITVPIMTVSQLELNLPYEFRDFVTEDSANYFYDYLVANTLVDDEGNQTGYDLLAAAAPKAVIAEYSEMLRKAGFKLKLALPREMAFVSVLRHYIARDPLAVQKEYCIVDVGYNRTTVDIYSGTNHSASKVIDFGCRSLDETIADIYGVDLFIASSYRDADFEGVLSRPECGDIYGRLAVEVRKTLNFYNYDNPGNDLKDLYYCGTGSQILPLVSAIGEQSGLADHSIAELFPPEIAGVDNLSICALALAMSMEGQEAV